jgi:hypothetical protein
MSDLGIFGGLVANGGALIAAGGALGLAWRGGSKWGPESVSIKAGPERVGLLLAALSIAILWVAPLLTPYYFAWRFWTMIGAGVACLLGLLIYSALRTIYVFDQEYAIGRADAATRKVIGGLWLTSRARASKRTYQVSVQTLLKGAGNDLDMIWPRPARALAEALFILGYLTLTMGGTIGLAAASLLIG